MLRVQHGQIRLSTNVHHDMSQLCAVTGGSHDTCSQDNLQLLCCAGAETLIMNLSKSTWFLSMHVMPLQTQYTHAEVKCQLQLLYTPSATFLQHTSAKYCHSSNLHHSSTISQALTSSPCMLSSATGSLQWDSEFDVCNRHRR